MNTYLDFELVNLTNKDVPAECFLNLQSTIPPNTYNKISISRLDVDVGSAFYFMRVPLVAPQTFYDVNNSFPEYAGIVDDEGNKFNQENGYFKTEYSIILSYLDNNNNIKLEEFPILFKSDEVKFNYDNIEKKQSDTPGDYIYNNFNNYFCSYNANNVLNSINQCIKYIISDRLNITNVQYQQLLPKFRAENINNRLCIDYLSFGLNNDLQEDNTVEPLQVEYPEQTKNFTYPGSHSSQKLFAFGVNRILNGLLYHSLVSKEYDSKDLNNLDNNFNTNETFYFLKLEQILEVSLSIPDVSTPTIKYNISTQYQSEFGDQTDNKLILLTGSLPMNMLYCMIKNKDYVLNKKQDNNLDTQTQNVLWKLSINNNNLSPQRFIYSNPNICNNYSTLIGTLNNTNYNLKLQIVDKYNNITDLLLSPYDKIYVQLCAFS